MINIKGINTCPAETASKPAGPAGRAEMGVHLFPRPLQISWYCAFLNVAAKVNSIVVVNLLNILQTAEVQHRGWTAFLRLRMPTNIWNKSPTNVGPESSNHALNYFRFCWFGECYSFYLFGWFLCICGKFIYWNCKKKRNCLVRNETSRRESRKKSDLLDQ